VKLPIYLDYHATTPVDRRVLDVMLPYFLDCFGNPASSTHEWGWKAQEAVEESRRKIAGLIGATAREIVFTSGATESNNLAIRGCTDIKDAGRNEIVTSAIEHKSVLESCKRLETLGWKVTYLPIDANGIVDLAQARAAISERTLLVSVMFANNEIGTLQPLYELSQLAHACGALVHSDAAQAAGKVPIDVNALGAADLTDKVWLHGWGEQAVVDAIQRGKDNQMTAHADKLTPEQIRVLAAYVWSLSQSSLAASKAP
jgi:cysteine desulfurase